MHESHPEWKRFIDSFPDHVARYDHDYKHLYINRAIEQEIGMSAAEVIGKSNRDLKIPNDEAFLAELERKIRHVFSTGEATENYTQHEFPDQTRYYYMKLSPDFKIRDGQKAGVNSVWAITRDITQLKQAQINLQQAEKHLQQQNLELNQLNTDLDTFFYAVSHDLRGPLNNITSMVELMKGGKPEQLTAYLKMLEKSTQRVSNILTGLTEVLEVKKNQQEQVEEIELNTVLQQVLVDFEEVIQQTRTTVEADFSGCASLYYNTPFLESIFRNMISNAIKYRSGNRLPHIQISCRRVNSFVELHFQDNGQGIKLEKNREKIFRPFFQLDSKQEGKGMGLNIVKNIVERNGGQIAVESEPGEGTTFICSIREYEEPGLEQG
jgi:PAS domain S-box-containing protein